jgi:hypothetical protein
MNMEFDDTTLYAGGLLVACCSLIYLILVLAGRWKVYVKAGKPGWAAIIPIYNIWVLLQIVGRPGWWIILFFIPFVNFIMSIVISFDVAESFEHGIPFALGLFFFPFIFYLILGFGDDKYAGPAAAPKMARDWRQ